MGPMMQLLSNPSPLQLVFSFYWRIDVNGELFRGIGDEQTPYSRN